MSTNHVMYSIAEQYTDRLVILHLIILTPFKNTSQQNRYRCVLKLALTSYYLSQGIPITSTYLHAWLSLTSISSRLSTIWLI